jgi:ribosome biogenesis GTPase
MDELKSTSPVAVGDHVCFKREEDPTTGTIEEIKERRNYIIRRASNLSKQTQILAANIDQAVLVATINYPVTTAVFIDRFLATAEAYRIPVTLVFNKTDRYDLAHQQQLADMVAVYTAIGYDVLTISAKKEENLELVKALLQDKVTLLAGHSGVGKSTLVNRLEPSLNLKTAAISEAHRTGRHTTTFAEMHSISFGGYIIDTPGIRGFGLFNIEKEELFHYFREIFKSSNDCQFHNCTHLHEPGCAVKQAVEDGKIALSRYNSYLSIFLNRDEKYRL